MQQSTKVETRVVGDVGIMDLSGEVTSFSEVEMHKAYDTFTQDGINKIGLNYENVSYINSAGMAIIIGILTKSRKRGQTIRSWGLTDHFQKIFEMVGISKYVDHFPSEQDAMKEF